MDGITNAGGVAAFAVISAKYPAGSICTCSDGNIRFTAKATSDSALFFIPYAGTWIVTATDPTGANKPASETVEITKEGENVSVELSFELWLIKDGVLQTEFVVANRKASAGIDTLAGFANNNYEESTGTHVLHIKNAYGWSSNAIETAKAFSVSGFTALNIQGWYTKDNAGTTGDSYAYCFEGNAPTYNNDCPGKVNIPLDAEILVTIPLSGFNSVNAGINLAEFSGEVATRIRNMWFS